MSRGMREVNDVKKREDEGYKKEKREREWSEDEGSEHLEILLSLL